MQAWTQDSIFKIKTKSKTNTLKTRSENVSRPRRFSELHCCNKRCGVEYKPNYLFQ